MGDERRSAERFTIWLPLELIDEESRTLAVSRNLSESGALLLVSGEFEPGHTVTLEISQAGTPRKVSGKVVRVGRNQQDPDGLWPLEVGIAFDEPVPELEALVKNVTEKLAQAE